MGHGLALAGLDVLDDFSKAADPGAVCDIGEIVVAVDEYGFHANAPGTDNIQVVLVTDVYRFLRLDLGFLERGQEYLRPRLIATYFSGRHLEGEVGL